MAIQMLQGMTEIGGYSVSETDIPRIEGIEDFVVFDHQRQTISFTIQNGPPKEVGINGCRVETILEVVGTIIEGLNGIVPCRENEQAITKIDEAIMWLGKRTADRRKRGVEGTSSD